MDKRLQWHENVEAFVIGALDRSERSLFEEHLRACETCKVAVASYAPCVRALKALRGASPRGNWERFKS
jgi:anti-sigma factor RsiW